MPTYRRGWQKLKKSLSIKKTQEIGDRVRFSIRKFCPLIVVFLLMTMLLAGCGLSLTMQSPQKMGPLTRGMSRLIFIRPNWLYPALTAYIDINGKQKENLKIGQILIVDVKSGKMKITVTGFLHPGKYSIMNITQ